jgi:hypothetical protein
VTGRAGTRQQSPYPPRVIDVNLAGVRGRRSDLPRQASTVSERGLGEPQGILTAEQELAEAIVPARCLLSAEKGQTANAPGVGSSRNEHGRQSSPDRGPGGRAKEMKALGLSQRAEQFLAWTANKG